MAAFYAIYHGPEGLKLKANHTHAHTLLLAEGLKASNNKILNKNFFDTIKVKPAVSMKQIKERAESKKINLRFYDDEKHVGISLDETVSKNDLNDLFEIFDCKTNAVI